MQRNSDITVIFNQKRMSLDECIRKHAAQGVDSRIVHRRMSLGTWTLTEAIKTPNTGRGFKRPHARTAVGV